MTNTISKELNTLRFGDSLRKQNSDPESGVTTGNEFDSAIEIDVANLPDHLITTIENMIKQERPEIVICSDKETRTPNGELNFISQFHLFHVWNFCISSQKL